MYRTHIQCADVGRAAWPKPASLSARGLNSGLGESTTQMDSVAAGSAGQGGMRGDLMCVLLGRSLQGRLGAYLKSCLPPFPVFVCAICLRLEFGPKSCPKYPGQFSLAPFVPFVASLKLSGILLSVCAVFLALSLLGCSQREFGKITVKEIEKGVADFYETKTLTGELRVTEISPEERVEGFCVLSAYEDRVTADSEKIISVNAFLEEHGLVGEESHWHLIIKTASGFRIAKFDTARTPLITPRPAYEGSNCVATRSIVFFKQSIAKGGSPLIGGGPSTRIVINVQAGD